MAFSLEVCVLLWEVDIVSVLMDCVAWNQLLTKFARREAINFSVPVEYTPLHILYVCTDPKQKKKAVPFCLGD